MVSMRHRDVVGEKGSTKRAHIVDLHRDKPSVRQTSDDNADQVAIPSKRKLHDELLTLAPQYIKKLKPYMDSRVIDSEYRKAVVRAHRASLKSRGLDPEIDDDVTLNDQEYGVEITTDENAQHAGVDRSSSNRIAGKADRRPAANVQRGMTRSGRPRKPRYIVDVVPESTNPAADAQLEEGAPMPEMRHMKSLHMHEEDKVITFLRSRVTILQQLAVKKISKAWIKAICPKKQAKFPYQNRKRVDDCGEKPVVPRWWPDITTCPFTEPDHVKKDQRTDLVLHLLRLRPTPEELKAMNNDTCEPHPTHVTECWTAFLQEATPAGCLDDLSTQHDDNPERRRKLLKQMYDVAQMEDEYKTWGMDQQYQYDDEADKPAPAPKRKKPKRRVDSVSTSSGRTVSRLSPIGCHGRSSRRQRRPSEVPTTAHSVTDQRNVITLGNGAVEQEGHASPTKYMETEHPSAETTAVPDRKPRMESFIEAPDDASDAYYSAAQWPAAYNGAAATHESKLDVFQASQLHTQSSTMVSPATSFDSSSTATLRAFDPYEAHAGGQSFFPGNPDFSFAQWAPHDQPPTNMPFVQAYHVGNVAQPQFDIVPDTPVFSPTTVVYPPRQHPHDVQGMEHTTGMICHAAPRPWAGTPAMPCQPQYIEHHGVQPMAPSQHFSQGFVSLDQQHMVAVGGLPVTYSGYEPSIAYAPPPGEYAALYVPAEAQAPISMAYGVVGHHA